MIGKREHEARISAIQEETEDQGRVSRPNGNGRRTQSVGAAPSEGPHQADERLTPAGCPADLPVPARPDRGLSRVRRLRRSEDIQDAFAQHRSLAGRLLVLYVRAAPDASLRVGVIAGKRTFPRAVDRARAKRLLRESYRLNRRRLAGAVDVVLVARRTILDVKRQAVDEELLKLARKAGLLGG
jgi:ribonuclease P protein component